MCRGCCARRKRQEERTKRNPRKLHHPGKQTLAETLPVPVFTATRSDENPKDLRNWGRQTPGPTGILPHLRGRRATINTKDRGGHAESREDDNSAKPNLTMSRAPHGEPRPMVTPSQSQDETAGRPRTKKRNTNLVVYGRPQPSSRTAFVITVTTHSSSCQWLLPPLGNMTHPCIPRILVETG